MRCTKPHFARRFFQYSINDGFRNIPQAIYWSIVTITTVGYGDAAPVTVLGKMMASVIMLAGFAIIAVTDGRGVCGTRARDKPGAAGPASLWRMRLGAA